MKRLGEDAGLSERGEAVVLRWFGTLDMFKEWRREVSEKDLSSRGGG